MLDLYNHESFGTRIGDKNGFAEGKKWMSVTIAMWMEDISQGNLMLYELYEDPNLPDWWLDSIFKSFG